MARNKSIDVARGIAITLVVIGHNRIGPVAIAALYAFHVQTFFLLTGATFNFAKYREALVPFAADRFRRLVIPYLFSAVIFYLLWYVIGRKIGQDAARAIPPWEPLVGILYGNGVGDWLVFNAPLWFLPALFVSGILLWLVLRATEGAGDLARWAVVLVAALAGYGISRLVILPWGADLALVVLVFMFLGYELNRRGRLRDDTPPLPILGAVLAAGLLALALFTNADVDTAQRRYHNFLLFLVGGVSGGLLVLYVSYFVARLDRLTALFTYLGRESLIILIFHLFGMQVLSALVVFGLGLEAEPVMTRFWWAYVIFAIAFSLIVAAVIKRIPPLRSIYYGTPAPSGQLRAQVPPGDPRSVRV